MYPHVVDKDLWFPDVEETLPDGLLAIGGDLSTDRLLLAYQNGIFPWYDEGEPMWWCPDPRFVLFPQNLKVSKSMKQVIKKGTLEFRIDSAFTDVIHNCRMAPRPGQARPARR